MLHLDYRHLGASPDGLVLDYPETEHRQFNLLEIECPFAAFKEHLSVEEATKRKLPCPTASELGLELNQHHLHYWQVQGQLAISNLPG